MRRAFSPPLARPLLDRVHAWWLRRHDTRAVARAVLWLVLAAAVAVWLWVLWTESINRR